MKIKDIRTLREFFKTTIRRTNDERRNPHFAGYSTGPDDDPMFGFFDLYHAYKPNIENLLNTILEMARDSQALYEFMQNAVDAESTDFILFHHHHEASDGSYLVVLNNGNFFDASGVLAILNIAASDKYNDPRSIGQFGVGFKLAHRLVGEETGLKALMEQNKGPILFSWKNDELSQLALDEEYAAIDPLLTYKNRKPASNDDHPWLFKILYTNFPVFPVFDSILDVNGQPLTDAFSVTEIGILREVAAKILCETAGRDFSQGSLLLIPLHPDKISELENDSAKYGLEISTTILNERSGRHKKLERILLNEHLLSTLQTEVEIFTFDVHEIYASGDPSINLFDKIEVLEIMFLYGDPLVNGNIFSGKPQFYLYFPMTEERHGFNFAIHCNGFSFTSARTALQDKIQRNKLIFQLLIDGIGKRLKGYAETNKTRFEAIYTSILLSQRGEANNWKENREWLEEDFWIPLMAMVREFTPVMDTEHRWRLADPKEKVFIKTSSLPLEKWFPEKRAWFYWNEREYPALCRLAADKMGAVQVGLLNVLEQKSTVLAINKWLTSDMGRSEKLLSELDAIGNIAERAVWDNIAELRLWTFDDLSLSVVQLSEIKEYRHYLISYGIISELMPMLTRAGFLLSNQKLGQYKTIEADFRNRNSGRLPYLFDYLHLNRLLSEKFSDPELFDLSEKEFIFSTILRAIRDSGSKANDTAIRMRVLALFANDRGQVKALEEIVQMEYVPEFLKRWKFKQSETPSQQLVEFTATSKEQIYENILLRYWLDIVHSTDSNEVKNLFQTTKEYFLSKPQMSVLPEAAIRFSLNGLVPEVQPFLYHQRLKEIEPKVYESLQIAMQKIGLGAIPRFDLLSFYEDRPFGLRPTTAINAKIPDEGVRLTPAEAIAIFRLYGFFAAYVPDRIIFSDASDGYVNLRLKSPNLHQCVTRNEEIRNYIKNWTSAGFVVLPLNLATLENTIRQQEEDLINFFVDHFDSGNDANVFALVSILSYNGKDNQIVKFMQRLGNTRLFNVEQHVQMEDLLTRIVSLCLKVESYSHKMQLLSRILAVEGAGSGLTRLASIKNRGSDEIRVELSTGVKLFSAAVLLGENSTTTVNKILTSVACKWEALGLGMARDIEDILGVRERRDIKSVLEDLNNHLSDKKIENVTQLAFILLSNQTDSKTIGQYKLLTAGGWQTLDNGIFYSSPGPARTFLPDNICLDSRYEGILTEIYENKTAFKFGNFTLVPSPYLEDGSFLAPGLVSLKVEQRSEFLQYLKALWKLASPEKLFFHGSQREWQCLIGIDPTSLVLDEEWRLPDEVIPLDLLDVFDEERENHREFLSSLGMQGVDSPIVEWRKYFAGGGILPKQMLDARQALRTLYWLAGRKVSLRAEILANLYAVLADEGISQIPLPVCGAGSDDLMITIPSTVGLKYISDSDQKSAARIGLSLTSVSSVTKLQLIPELSILQKIWSKVVQKYMPIDIKWSQVDWRWARLVRTEWTYKWYRNWAINAGVHIFSIPGNVLKYVEAEEVKVFEFREGDILVDHGRPNEVYLSSELDTSAAFNRLDKQKLFSAGLLDGLRASYNAHSNYLTNLLDKIQNNSFFDDFNDQLEEVERHQERQEAADRLQNSEYIYTTRWFLDLLKIVRKQEQNAKPPEIEFQTIRPRPEFNGVYELSNGSTTIPANIEEYLNIKANVKYRTGDGKIGSRETIVEVTRKHQTLWVVFPAVAIQEVLQKDIISVTITYSRTTNLIGELTNGFERLGLDDDFNFKDNLSHNFHFIFGPPGTGKTTELAKRLIQRINKDASGPVIILTPTNKAADVLTHKIIQHSNGQAPSWLVRFGSCADPDLLALNVVKSSEEVAINRNSHTVLITTIHRFPYSPILTSASNTDKYPLYQCPWSLVVFDESSMIPLPYIMFAVYARQLALPATEFIVAGDPLQIPPVFDLNLHDLELETSIDHLQKENIYSMIRLTSFDNAVQRTIPIYGENGKIENLQVQHRSIPVIGDLFSFFQYNGRLKHSRSTAENKKPGTSRALPRFFSGVGFKPITVVRYRVDSSDTIFNPKRLNQSPYHIQTALIITQLLKRFQDEVEKEDMQQWTVGVISPYKAQAGLMAKMIDSAIAFSRHLNISVDTVHGFQGDENQLIIAVLNPGNANVAYSRLLKEAHILNVAVSRAEDYLILLVPDEQATGLSGLSLIQRQSPNSLLNIINSFHSDLRTEMHAEVLEKALMGDASYFEKNTRTTNHLPVNVYGDTQLPYLFRIANSAVDVHWQH